MTVDTEQLDDALALLGLGDDGLVHGCGCGRPHPPARSAIDTDRPRWRRIRVAILKRDRYLCRVPTPTGELCGAPATVAGHVLGRRLGGCDDPSNLRAECKRCSDTDGGAQQHDERAAIQLARVLVARGVTRGDGAVSSRGVSTEPPGVSILSLSRSPGTNAQVRGSSSTTPDTNSRSTTAFAPPAGTRAAEPVTVRESPGPDDPVWDAAPWLDELREVPPEGVWPRFMTLPHPDAVGTYGLEVVELFERMYPRRRLRWWQRLAAFRILEHDADGLLVWGEYLGTISRQGGKSWLLRVLALWRLLYGGPRWGDEQLVLHTGKDVAILREVLKPAQSWGEANGLVVSRNNLEPGLATGAHMTGNRWIIRAKDAVYGYAATNPLVDEAWAVPASVIDEGLEPTTVEQVSPQLGLWSTAHRRSTGLMLERRANALGELFAPVRTLLLEWSTPEGVDRGDPAGWRRASPHWSRQREALVAKSYRKVLRGESLDPEEPDPIASFDAQWLNRWPDPVPLEQRLVDEPLLHPAGIAEARSAWQACLDAAAAPDPGAALYLAVEVDGSGAAAAAAALTADGRVLVGGWRFANRTEAVDWCQDTGEDAADPLLLIGASMIDDPELAGLEIPTEPSGGVETRAALPLLRELVLTGRIAHDGGADTTEAVLGARVRPGVAGTAMLLTGNESTALVRALGWAMRRAHLDRV